MRLTTYNIAVKALGAKRCLSDTVDRMWGYMDEGDVDQAQCAREQAITLDSLINALEGWTPVIADGKTITYTVTYVSGAFTFPFNISSITVNTMESMNPVTIYSGDNTTVFRAVAEAINTYLNGNSDKFTVKMSVNSIGGLVATFVFKYTDDMSPLVFTSTSLTSGITTTLAVTTEADIEESPYCLTDDQLLSIIGKIDEVCECGC